MVFLAGVAIAKIFKGNNLFATAKTLIDSSITIGVSAEDIRAGQGATLYGKYFHTSTFDLKMTDAMFNLEYISANVGADLTLGGDVFTEEEHIIKEGEAFELANKVVPMTEGGKRYIYYRDSEKGEDSYVTYALTDDDQATDNNVTIANLPAGTYCVKYLYTNDLARKLVVNANFTPDTLSVFLTANLYSGDVSDFSTSTKIGTVTIKVPRFLLSGSQELSMSMTGAANTAFEGSALATKGKGCEGDGIYAEIIEIIKNSRKYIDIIITGQDEGLDLSIGDKEQLIIYGKKQSGELVKLNDIEKLRFLYVQKTPPHCDNFISISDNGELIAEEIGSGYIYVVVDNIISKKMNVSVDCYFDEVINEKTVQQSNMEYDYEKFMQYSNNDNEPLFN